MMNQCFFFELLKTQCLVYRCDGLWAYFLRDILWKTMPHQTSKCKIWFIHFRAFEAGVLLLGRGRNTLSTRTFFNGAMLTFLFELFKKRKCSKACFFGTMLEEFAFVWNIQSPFSLKSKVSWNIICFSLSGILDSLQHFLWIRLQALHKFSCRSWQEFLACKQLGVTELFWSTRTACFFPGKPLSFSFLIWPFEGLRTWPFSPPVVFQHILCWICP